MEQYIVHYWKNKSILKKELNFCLKPPEGIEPSTPCLQNRCSDRWAMEAYDYLWTSIFKSFCFFDSFKLIASLCSVYKLASPIVIFIFYSRELARLNRLLTKVFSYFILFLKTLLLASCSTISHTFIINPKFYINMLLSN